MLPRGVARQVFLYILSLISHNSKQFLITGSGGVTGRPPADAQDIDLIFPLGYWLLATGFPPFFRHPTP
jgi:hypothetical protein